MRSPAAADRSAAEQQPQQQQPQHAAAADEPEPQGGATQLRDLPAPVLEHLLGAFVPAEDAAAARLVCRAWREAIAGSPQPLQALARPLAWAGPHLRLPDFAGRVQALQVSRVASLAPLAGLTRLTSLAVLDSRSLQDLGPLASLARSLRRLSLRACREATAEPLAQLAGLEVLLIDRCAAARDLRGLAACSALTSLRLGFDCWTAMRLELPATLPAIAELRLMAEVQDLAPLAAFTSLRSLEVYAVSAHSLEPLRGLGGLRCLTLHQLQDDLIDSPAALGDLTLLSSLSLRGADAGIVALTPWGRLAGCLRRLDLHGSAVSDLEPLGCLADALEWLSLAQRGRVRKP